MFESLSAEEKEKIRLEVIQKNKELIAWIEEKIDLYAQELGLNREAALEIVSQKDDLSQTEAALLSYFSKLSAKIESTAALEKE